MSVLSALLLPSGFAYALCAVGFLAAAWARTRRFAIWAFAASALIALAFSSGMIAATLMSPLEYEYPTLRDATRHPEASHIVVLTGWAADDPLMPLTGRFNSSTAYRVLLTLELAHERPDCDVIVSGSPVAARLMRDALVKLGVSSDRLRLDDTSPDTMDSADHLRAFVGDDPFFLVTSGGHMPRAVAAVRSRGLKPVAAPTDHQQPKDWRNANLGPSPQSLVTSDLAVHEIIARAWYRLRES